MILFKVVENLLSFDKGISLLNSSNSNVYQTMSDYQYTDIEGDSPVFILPCKSDTRTNNRMECFGHQKQPD